MYLNGKGILTLFPFPHIQLGVKLGLTYSQLNCIAEKPLPFQYYRFSLYIDLTTTRILIFARFIFFHKKTSALTKRLPTISFLEIYNIGN